MKLIFNTRRPRSTTGGSILSTRKLDARACSGLALVAVLTGALSAPVSAQESRPDQVFVINVRSGSVVANSGSVTVNGLDEVTIERSGGAEQSFKSERVRNVIFGDVPVSYREGILLRDRNDRFNAAAKFKLAAADEDAREVVRASARLLAAEMLLVHGAVDASAYADADTAATRFIEEHSANREMPRARFVQAQARLAQGQFASAAELFGALFNETSGVDPKEGYDPYACTIAGLRAADSFLMAKDTLAAREIYSALEAKLPGIIAALDEDDSTRNKWISAQSEARLGEGFVLLAAGSAGQSRAFFDQQTTDADSPAALRFGVRLGNGLVHLAEGNYRRAQFELATVSSIDHTDRNRAARALIGLAQSALNLPDTGGRTQAKSWLQSVLDHYPDTIWVHSAQELIQTL
ncbi:MAG: TolA-binding protein [Planctomycetota bacterium]|jgi:TolA-binding protein